MDDKTLDQDSYNFYPRCLGTSSHGLELILTDQIWTAISGYIISTGPSITRRIKIDLFREFING